MRYVVVAERTETYRLAVKADSPEEAKSLVWAFEPDVAGDGNVQVLERTSYHSALANFRVRVVRPAEERADASA